MEQLSLLDKFKVLFNNIFEHPLFIILLLVPAIMFLLQKKHGKKAFVFVYLLVIIFVLYIGGGVIFELFDNLMDGLFMTLYFPNFITLFVVVVLCSIIALISFFSKKMFRINKIINITGFAIIQMLFVLILTLVKSKNINIYADNALYSNSDVLTLMQLLIGTFTLQVIAILIINGINKVTDILDKRSTVLGKEIEEGITNLEKTKKNNLGLIRNIEIDNTKIGYINVADKSTTSKPKLKPFKFDMKKLESVTLNVPEVVLDEEPFKNEDLIIDTKVSLKEKFDNVLNDTKANFEKKTFKKKEVLLPKEKSEPIVISNKPDLLSPMKDAEILSDIKGDEGSKGSHKFVNEINLEEVKPDLLKHDNFINIVGKVDRPKLVHGATQKKEDLVDKLNILDIQSTLDTVIKYKLMKGVCLKVLTDEVLAVDNLQIPNFNKMTLVLHKYKLYRKV